MCSPLLDKPACPTRGQRPPRGHPVSPGCPAQAWHRLILTVGGAGRAQAWRMPLPLTSGRGQRPAPSGLQPSPRGIFHLASSDPNYSGSSGELAEQERRLIFIEAAAGDFSANHTNNINCHANSNRRRRVLQSTFQPALASGWCPPGNTCGPTTTCPGGALGSSGTRQGPSSLSRRLGGQGGGRGGGTKLSWRQQGVRVDSGGLGPG